jgi:hypothetical protein
MEPSARGHLRVAAEYLAQMNMFEFILAALEVALELERKRGQEELNHRVRQGLQGFRGETLTIGPPRQVGHWLGLGSELTPEQEAVAHESYRKHRDELAARVSALLDEFDG